MIIDPENQNNNNNNGLPNSDDYVDSSFMVSFKANESSSVSDKIKESENASDPFEDEFDNFDFDASKSAFKPLDKPVTAEASAPIAEPPKASDKTDFEQVAPVNDPAFTDADLDFKEFTGVKEDPNVNKSLFESGQDLDFAGSADSKSPFTTGGDDEFALDEEAMAINPFKPKNADRIPPMPSMPKAGKVPDPALKAQPKADEPKEAANIKTYGKVSSGVDAFKKPAKEETPAPAPAPAASKPAPSPFKAAEVKAPAAPAPSPFEKKAQVPVMPSSVKKEAAPAPEEKSPFVMNQAEPVKKPQSNVAKVSANTRPAATEAKPAAAETPAAKPAFKSEEAHTAPRANTNNNAHKTMRQQPLPDEKEAGSRPGTSHSTSSDHKKTDIEPVTTVKKSKKKSKREKSSKEPGRGGLFALIGVLAGIFVLLWVLDNYQTWFGKNDDTTRATQVTAVTTVTEVVETDAAETSEAVITEETQAAVATTETTAEQTTAETTVETTEETTEATTEATTEQTTTTTTEEETTATTTRSSSSNTPVSCSYTIRNPRVTSDGFVFDLSVTNNGDTVNMNRLNEFTISFDTSSTITNLTSDYFTFTSEGNNSFSATPRSGSLPAGERTDITITGTTENHVAHFYINTYHFDWN